MQNQQQQIGVCKTKLAGIFPVSLSMSHSVSATRQIDRLAGFLSKWRAGTQQLEKLGRLETLSVLDFLGIDGATNIQNPPRHIDQRIPIACGGGKVNGRGTTPIQRESIAPSGGQLKKVELSIRLGLQPFIKRSGGDARCAVITVIGGLLGNALTSITSRLSAQRLTQETMKLETFAPHAPRAICRNTTKQFQSGGQRDSCSYRSDKAGNQAQKKESLKAFSRISDLQNVCAKPVREWSVGLPSRAILRGNHALFTMKTKTFNISPEVMAVLQRSTINSNSLALPPEQLERSLYEQVNKVLTMAGGKWNKSARAHLFTSDPRAKLGLALETGKVVNEKQTFQFFPTPDEIAHRMIQLADLTAGDRVLEPSAGTGQLVKAVRSAGIFKGDVTAVEINPQMAEPLKELAGTVVCGDFLEQNGNLGTFDRVLMNPPFTGGQDIKHIRHAMGFLASGRLVAICLDGPKQREALQPLSSQWVELPEGTFKESGTNVRTAMVLIEA